MKTKLTLALTSLYASLILAGAVMAFFALDLAPYIFSAGVVIVFVDAFMQIYQLSNASMRQKRIGRLRFVSALMLAFAAYYMFIANNSWVIFLLIYALTTLFLSFRTPEK